MALRPVDVRRREFKSGFRGYDANQVDDFLDEVADEFERTFAENLRLAEEITVLKGRLEQFDKLEGSIQDALVHAQEAARDLRQNASREAELIVREAKEQAHQILAESSSRVERVKDSYEVLQQAKRDFTEDFRHLLKSYMTVMDNADVASAREIEASLRERLDLESVGAAREAAEIRRLEASEESAGSLGDETRDADTTQRIETAPTGAVTDPEPEVDEPEVDPSSARGRADQETSPGEADARGRDAAEEVDREEPMPAGEGQTADRFFEEGERRNQEDTEERKIFRASRFLRRRG